MKFNTKDIQLFILTYNRPAMCVEALESLLKQKGDLDIHVLDNSDNDETEKLIVNYHGVKYHRTPKDVKNANFKEMLQLMDKPYTLTLHDDDLLHPQYLELCLKALNKYDDISFIGSKNTFFYDEKLSKNYLNPQVLSTQYWLLENQPDFAMTFWTTCVPSWSGCIIKSEFYKQTNTDALQKKYGKISDWPMIIETMKTGKALIFTDNNCMFYRKHSGQDSCDRTTGISLANLLAWMNLFKRFAQTNNDLWKIYFLRAAKNAISNFERFVSSVQKKQFTSISFLNYLATNNILTPAMLFYTNCSRNVFLRILNVPFKIYYQRNYYKRMIKKL